MRLCRVAVIVRHLDRYLNLEFFFGGGVFKFVNPASLKVAELLKVLHFQLYCGAGSAQFIQVAKAVHMELILTIELTPSLVPRLSS